MCLYWKVANEDTFRSKKFECQCKFLQRRSVDWWCPTCALWLKHQLMLGFAERTIIMAIFLRLNRLFPFLVCKGDHQVTEAKNFPILNFHKNPAATSSQIYRNGPHSCSSFIVHSICTYNKNLNEQLSLSQPTKKKVFLPLAFKSLCWLSSVGFGKHLYDPLGMWEHVPLAWVLISLATSESTQELLPEKKIFHKVKGS